MYPKLYLRLMLYHVSTTNIYPQKQSALFVPLSCVIPVMMNELNSLWVYICIRV